MHRFIYNKQMKTKTVLTEGVVETTYKTVTTQLPNKTDTAQHATAYTENHHIPTVT
jgi:hypothetical protein